MTNLDSALKSRDITLPVKVCVVKAMVFPYVWIWELDHKEGWAPKNWYFQTGVLEKSRESLGLQGNQTTPSKRKWNLNIHWKDWCWSWSSSFEAKLKAGGERNDRGWEGWMASLTRWTWAWVSSRSWWWTGKPGVLLSMGSQRVGHD